MTEGIVSGIVASVCFSIIMFAIRPRFKVSKQIAVSRGELSIYKIKVVNTSRSMLTNVRYSLHYCVDYTDGTSDISEIDPKKSKLDIISRYSRSDEQASYAVRISYKIDESKYPMMDNTRLIFTILADHAYSNTTTCKKIDYKKEDLVEGIFETKKSTQILSVKH